jgi:hypothetical protein
MPQKPLPANKIRQLLHFSVDDYFNKTETAKGLRIALKWTPEIGPNVKV